MYVLGFITTPKRSVSIKIARALIKEKRAACVNIVPKVLSVYEWEGRLQTDGEEMLIVKTTRGKADALTRRVRELHPYKVPEIIFCRLTSGSGPYLKWIRDALKKPPC